MGIQIKRAYEAASPDDGYRILVDRLWPRGIRKENLPLDAWLKDIAPSDSLRRWFNHDPAHFEEFSDLYRQELAHQGTLVDELRARARHGRLTLVYGARDPVHNHARVLMEYLQKSGTRAHAR